MALGDGTVWNESYPDDSTLANQIDDYNRELRIAVRKRMANEHVWPGGDTQTGTGEAGHHKFISFQQQTATPTILAASGQVGCLFVGSSAAGYPLMYENSASTECILVNSAGEIAGIPTGAVMPYGGTTSPDTWYLCNGTAVSRTTDAALFAVVGVLYGTGDNSTTFNVPDLRTRVPVGYKSGDDTFGTVGTAGGEKTHVLTIAEMPAHIHTVPMGEGAAYADGGPRYTSGSSVAPPTTSTGGDGAHNNIQPYVTMNYIIKR